MKVTILVLASWLALPASAEQPAIDNGLLKRVAAPKPVAQLDYAGPETPGISLYSSSELFPFDDDAKAAGEERAAVLRNFGITVLGVNVVEKDRDYSFTIEYSPKLKNPESIRSVLLKEYAPAKSYWNGSSAEKALAEALANFRNSPLKPLDSRLTENGGYSFSIVYPVNNLLKKSPDYYAKFEKTVYGKYTFESQAEKDMPAAIARFRQSGIQAVGAKVVPAGRDYALEVEYLTKTGGDGRERPEYLIENYRCAETLNFESDALKAARAAGTVFARAGVAPAHLYAFETGNDWSFAVDYVVKNLYKKEGAVKEFEIRRYDNQAVFDFESEAEKALAEKKAGFDAAGLHVISSGVYETGRDYSFYLEYLEKQSVQPVPPGPRP